METVDRLALAALVRALPVHSVDAALESCGRVARRVRALPPWVTTYHVLASAMYRSIGYDEVTALLWSALPAVTGRGLARQPPTRGAVTRARVRLGSEPLAALLDQQIGAADEAPVDRVYLQKVPLASSDSLWWLCAAGTGVLHGCELSDDDDAAAVMRLIERVRPRAVVVCPPYESSVLGVLERSALPLAVTVGELPDQFAELWSTPGSRSPRASAQEALARACVRVALDTMLTPVRRSPHGA